MNTIFIAVSRSRHMKFYGGCVTFAFKTSRNPSTSASYSSGDNMGRFWMNPDGPTLDEVIISEPCGQCIDANKDPQAYVGFADILLRRVIRRSGIKDRYPIPLIGKWKAQDEDDDFLHNHRPPEPTDAKAVSEYIQRLCAILKNPDRTHLYDTAMERLVPISDSLRYKDSRIDEALLVAMRRGLAEKREPPPVPQIDYDLDKAEREKQRAARKEEFEKAYREGQKISDIKSAGPEAAEKLGMHDASQAFDELLGLGKDKVIPLMPAAKIAGRHPDLRRRLLEYLKADLSLEAIWRADMRELERELEQLAGSDSAYELFYKYTPEQEKAHHAAVLLATWREPDKLTKTKLDIMLTGAIGRAVDIPEVLRKEFSELSESDQLKVRNFVTWMRTVDVPWSRRYIENTFTPHTPEAGHFVRAIKRRAKKRRDESSRDHRASVSDAIRCVAFHRNALQTAKTTAVCKPPLLDYRRSPCFACGAVTPANFFTSSSSFAT
jgi:hypothetical protein